LILFCWHLAEASGSRTIHCVANKELPLESIALRYENPNFRTVNTRFSILDANLQWLEPGDISAIVLAPLTKFLTVRFQWIADNPTIRSLGAAASMQANNPYLWLTVHSQKSGLRIHYSKTFALNFNPVFGARTTPKSGWILPGIHKFAGIDGYGKFLYDKGTFTTPPDFTVNLTI
jgi:hypothetical protein